MVQRYIVFRNERRIIIEGGNNEPAAAGNILVVRYNGRNQLRELYERFEADGKPETLLVHAPDQFAAAKAGFESLFKKVKAAGGVVQNADGNFLFIRRFGLWDLPKGKLEAGEKAPEGALREVREETGLWPLVITKTLPCTRHIYHDSSGRRLLKKTSWYHMRYSGNETPVPQTAEQITECRWFPAKEMHIPISGTYASLLELLEALPQMKNTD